MERREWKLGDEMLAKDITMSDAVWDPRRRETLWRAGRKIGQLAASTLLAME